jgi:hypothetical protein
VPGGIVIVWLSVLYMKIYTGKFLKDGGRRR